MVPTRTAMLEETSASVKWKADLLCPAGNDVSCCMTASHLHSALPKLLFHPSVVGLLSSGLAHSSGVTAEFRVCREHWVKSCPCQCCLLLPQIQQNKELDVLDPARGWLTAKFKTGPWLFACPVKSKKTELPLNSLDKTQWHLCLCIWSFKVL